VRHPLVFSLNCVVTSFTALGLGLLFHGVTDDLPGVLNRCGVVFFLLSFFMLTGLVSLSLWQQERLLYFHEHSAGCYGPGACVLAKALCEMLPLRVLPVFFFGAVAYPLIGLKPTAEAAGWFALIVCLANANASALFNCIGIACANSALGTLVAVVAALLSQLLCGFILNKNSLSAASLMLTKLSVLNYAFEALMINELEGVAIVIKPKGIDVAYPTTGKVILDQIGIDEDNFSADVASLCVWLVVCVCFSYALLKWCVKETR